MPATTKKPIKIVPNTIKTIPKIKPATIIPKKTLEEQLEEIYDDIDIDVDDLPDELLEVYEELEGTYKEKSIQKNWKLWLSMFTPFILPAFIKGVSGQVTLPYDARQSVQSNAPEPKVVVDYAKKYFEEHGLELVKTLSKTDCERLKVQLKDNWGKGPTEFKKSFEEDYANTKARLDSIYRTEYVTAQNEGILARSRDAGHKMKQWNAALDERTCPVCGDQLHGTIIPIDEEFSAVVEHKNGSEEISVNGPPAHPNCRCVLTTLNEEDYDEIKEDSAYLEDVFETIKLNYKCPKDSVEAGTFKDGLHIREDYIADYAKNNQGLAGKDYDNLPEKYQKWFRLQKQDSAYLSEVTNFIKLNYKCKAGTVDDSNKCEPIDSKNNHIESYSKILESKVPKKFGNQVYLVRMGSEKENNTNIVGNVFVGNDINMLIKKALESSKESGNLIIGRCDKDAFEDDELDKISKNDFSVTSRYLGQSFSPVDVVIDTGTSDTIYKRSKDELEKEKNLFIAHESQLNKIEQNTALSDYRNFGYRLVNNVLRKNYIVEGENKKSILDPTPVYSKEYIDKALKDASLISDAMEPSKENKTLSRVDGAAVTATLFPVAGITEELTNYFKTTYEKGGKYPKTEDILSGNIKPPSEKTWDSYFTSKLKDLEFKDPAFSSTSKSESGIKKDLLVSSDKLSPHGITSLLDIEVPKGIRLVDMQERLGIGEGRYKTEKEVLLDKNTIFKIKSVKLEPHDNGMFARIKVKAIQKLPEPIKENSTSNNILVYFENSPIKSMDIAYLYDVVEYIKLNYKCPKGTVDDTNKCDIDNNPEKNTVLYKEDVTKLRSDINRINNDIIPALKAKAQNARENRPPSSAEVKNDPKEKEYHKAYDRLHNAESEVRHLEDRIFFSEKYKATPGKQQEAYNSAVKSAIELQIKKPDIFDENLQWGYLAESRNITKILKEHPDLPKKCQYGFDPNEVERYAKDVGVEIPLAYYDEKRFPEMAALYNGTKNHESLHRDIIYANHIGKIDELMDDSKLEQDIVVYSGVDPRFFDKLPQEPGTEVKINSFISSSRNETIAKGFASYQLKNAKSGYSSTDPYEKTEQYTGEKTLIEFRLKKGISALATEPYMQSQYDRNGIKPENELGPQAKIRNKETNSQEELILDRSIKFRVIGTKHSSSMRRIILESIL